MAKQKYTLTANQMPNWVSDHPCVKNYTDTLGDTVKDEHAQLIYQFCEWLKKSPEELLELKTSWEDIRAEQAVIRFKTASELKLPMGRRYKTITCVRGFFRENMKALQPAARMEQPLYGEQKAPKKEDRLKFYKKCLNPRDQALTLMIGCTAIALETLSNLRWSHFEADWMQQEIPHISIPTDLIKGHGRGKYRGVRQETFITPECKKAVIEYLEWLKKTYNYTPTQDSYVFVNIKRRRLGKMNKRVIATGLHAISLRSGVTWKSHDGRRIVQTALETAGCPTNWAKKIKGRKVSGEESPYSKPAIEQLRAKYREALPELEFLNQTTPEDQARWKDIEADVKDLKKYMRELEEKLPKT